MTVRFLHLYPEQLSLNGETGNLQCLVQRLSWAGIDSKVEVFDGSGKLPSDVDAVFIGSGTLAGGLEALEGLRAHQSLLSGFSNGGTPFLAFGLGWEILGQSVTLVSGDRLDGLGIYPSRSVRTQVRASAESCGFDTSNILTTGYANHSAEIELLDGAKPWITLTAGYGNSSTFDARSRSDEGLIAEYLFAARLNGPLLPLNPHLADEFLGVVSKRSGFRYEQHSPEAEKADGYAANARSELSKRLTR